MLLMMMIDDSILKTVFTFQNSVIIPIVQTKLYRLACLASCSSTHRYFCTTGSQPALDNFRSHGKSDYNYWMCEVQKALKNKNTV